MSVELTLAIHRVFRSPHDIILWDTGHQAYVHKLLTGRTQEFSNLRQEGGLSGYPSRAESDHDWVENSHASTVVSYAHGLATAHAPARRGPIATSSRVLGDGALTGGMAYEGLNNLGHSGAKAIIILNDNGRSYAPTVSQPGREPDPAPGVPDLPAQPRPHRTDHRSRCRWSAVVLEKSVDGAAAALREMFEPPGVLRAARREVPRAVRRPRHRRRSSRRSAAASEFDGPVVVHCLTQKGRGYGPAEDDAIKNMHDTSELKAGSYTAAFSEAIVAEGEAGPSWWPSPPPCPTRPGSCPSARSSPTA